MARDTNNFRLENVKLQFQIPATILLCNKFSLKSVLRMFPHNDIIATRNTRISIFEPCNFQTLFQPFNVFQWFAKCQM